ncbi:MAG TPA: helix-turn-helix transcriptional regulator [Chitinophagaceae bacterium]|nr:helix-turn-helix transcriptional regulator [Chitinophagaceae bacterium]
MISELLKEGRIAKGYTQKELSELSNISIRSIQRIENGEILPRTYTLKTLSEVLGLSFESLQKAEPVQKFRFSISRGQQIILSIGIPLFVFFAGWAFIAQSPRFPETAFELLTFIASALVIVTIIMVVIWRTKS